MVIIEKNVIFQVYVSLTEGNHDDPFMMGGPLRFP